MTGIVATAPRTTGAGPDRRRRMLIAALLVVGVGLWCARGWPRIAHPTLWAEDGTVFLHGAETDRFGSLLQPYAGYLHVVPRLIAMIPIPITWAPTVYAVAAVLVATAVAGIVLSPRMAWLLPRRWQPPLAFLALLLLPAADETFGNIANSIFWCGLGLVLLSLWADPVSRAGRVIELVVLGLLGLSGPFALFALPGFAARLYRQRSRHALLALVVVAAAAAVQWSILVFGSRVDRVRRNPLDAIDPLLFTGRSALGSWLFGDRWSTWSGWMTVAVLLLLAGVVIAGWRLGWTGVALAVTVLAGIGSAMLAWGYWTVRTGGGERHVLTPLGVLAVVLVAGLADRIRWRQAVAGLCLVAGLGGILSCATLRPLPFRPIGPFADCVRQGGAVCTAPLNPNPTVWKLILRR